MTDTDQQSVGSTIASNVQQGDVINQSNPQVKRRTPWQTARIALLIIGVILSMFCISLNSTVVAPAMNIIATELDAAELQTWIATSYMVAMNAFQPLSGKVRSKSSNFK